MARSQKARVIGNVICVQEGNITASLKGRSGDVVRRTHEGKVTVVRVDGRIYHIPTDMIEAISPAVKGVVAHG